MSHRAKSNVNIITEDSCEGKGKGRARGERPETESLEKPQTEESIRLDDPRLDEKWRQTMGDLLYKAYEEAISLGELQRSTSFETEVMLPLKRAGATSRTAPTLSTERWLKFFTTMGTYLGIDQMQGATTWFGADVGATGASNVADDKQTGQGHDTEPTNLSGSTSGRGARNTTRPRKRSKPPAGDEPETTGPSTKQGRRDAGKTLTSNLKTARGKLTEDVGQDRGTTPVQRLRNPEKVDRVGLSEDQMIYKTVMRPNNDSTLGRSIIAAPASYLEVENVTRGTRSEVLAMAFAEGVLCIVGKDRERGTMPLWLARQRSAKSAMNKTSKTMMDSVSVDLEKIKVDTYHIGKATGVNADDLRTTARRVTFSVKNILDDNSALASATSKEAAQPVATFLKVAKNARDQGKTIISANKFFEESASASKVALRARFGSVGVPFPEGTGTEADRRMTKFASIISEINGTGFVGFPSYHASQQTLDNQEQVILNAWTYAELQTQGTPSSKDKPRSSESVLDAISKDPTSIAPVINWTATVTGGDVTITTVHHPRRGLGTAIELVHAEPLDDPDGPSGGRIFFVLEDAVASFQEYLACLQNALVPEMTPEEREQMRYRDWNAPKEAGTWSPWYQTGTVANACDYADEHGSVAVDIPTLAYINKQRRKSNHNLPQLRWYPIIQKIGDLVLLKERTPYVSVTIGQTYSVAHNFLEPRHLEELYSTHGEGKNRCKCTRNDGVAAELELRPLEGVEEKEERLQKEKDAAAAKRKAGKKAQKRKHFQKDNDSGDDE